MLEATIKMFCLITRNSILKQWLDTHDETITYEIFFPISPFSPAARQVVQHNLILNKAIQERD